MKKKENIIQFCGSQTLEAPGRLVQNRGGLPLLSASGIGWGPTIEISNTEGFGCCCLRTTYPNFLWNLSLSLCNPGTLLSNDR